MSHFYTARSAQECLGSPIDVLMDVRHLLMFDHIIIGNATVSPGMPARLRKRPHRKQVCFLRSVNTGSLKKVQSVSR